MNEYPSVEVNLTSLVTPVGAHWEQNDRLREEFPVYWNTYGNGYWVLTRAEEIREASQNPAVFSNHSIVATDPNPAYRFLPSFVDPPQHMKYRKPLNRWFSPPAVAALGPQLRECAVTTMQEFAADGHTDYVNSFGDHFPVRVFLTSMGLPLEHAAFLVSCVRRMSGARSGSPDHVARMMGAWADIAAFWTVLLADRHANPLDPDIDFVTHMTEATIDGHPFADDEIIDTLVTLTLGSLDTLKGQFGWCIYHFATHPEDRQRIIDDPNLIPNAVEEILRAYPIVGMARKLTQDIEFHGCPMKKDDMLFLNLPSATRDPREFPDADKVIIDRSPNRHMAFGASEHRCVGSHLARAEMIVALEEWHRAIPHYRLGVDEPLMELGSQIALVSLPLVWDV